MLPSCDVLPMIHTLNIRQLCRNPSFVKQLDFISDDTQSKPHYQMVWSGRHDPKEFDFDTDVESASILTVEHATDEMQLDGLNV